MPKPVLLAAACPDNRAALALADQLRRPGRAFGVCLESLWRSVGQPPHESPEDWLILAAGLIETVSAYRRRVELAAGREAIKRPAVWTVTKRLAAIIGGVLEDVDAELFEVGDHLTCETVAGVYVEFLDQCGPRRPFTASGRLQRGAFLEMVAGLPQFNCPDPLPAAPAPSPAPDPIAVSPPPVG